MPLPSSSTAAVLKNLNPLSLSFIIRSFTVLLALLKIANAVSFTANDVKYILSPFNGTQANWDEHNSNVYLSYYNQMYAGKCGAHSLKSNDGVNRGDTVVSITSITVWKENFLPITFTDQCLRDLAFNVSNLILNTVQATLPQNTTPVASFNGSMPNSTYVVGDRLNYTAIIYGTVFPVLALGILLALGLSYFSRIKARLFGPSVEARENVPVEFQEIQVIAGQVAAAIDAQAAQPAVAAANVPAVSRVEVPSVDFASPTP